MSAKRLKPLVQALVGTSRPLGAEQDLEITLIAARGSRMSVNFPPGVELPERVRCAFVLRGDHPGRVEITARVLQHRQSEQATHAMVRWEAMVSREGRAPILLMCRLLRLNEPGDAHFAHTEQAVALFPSREAATKCRDRAEINCGPRVASQTPARTEMGGYEFAVLIRSMSPDALLIECDPILEELTPTLTVACSVPFEDDILHVVHDCSVAWSDSRGARILAGLSIRDADDGAMGTVWERYVEQRAAGADLPDPEGPETRPPAEIVIC